MTKIIIIAVLAVALLGLGFVKVSPLLGATGQTHYQVESFLQGLYGGTSRQFAVSNAGAVTAVGITNSSSMTVGGGTSISKFG